ncbi:MFS transporter [Variovorax terrae]|uniref:MFS transporter n=1 Tax=Variovorax terrae TaxID=2923278 RepID=A0A9X2AL72_9BURK|nr:MFS transporter [Variovorax terrae]MCJ0762004.1 MFS transporter [Variovorax terrae]
MALLALVTSVEFLESIMFVFASRHIMGGVDADPRSFALAQAAYAVGSMLMILKQQWLARRFGYRRYLTAALGLFMAGTLLAATSDSLAQLLAARFVQGVSAGAFFTSCRILVPLMFTPAERPRAMKWFMIGIFIAGALGPVAAAWLIDHGSWRDVFYGVLPLAALGLLGCWLLLPDAEPSREDTGWSLAPLLVFGAAAVALQWGFSEARFDIFSHPAHVLALALLGAGLLAAFLRHQHRHPTPLLQLRALGNPVYLTGLAFYFLYYLVSTLNGYVFPVFAGQALGLPLDVTGWLNSLAGLVSLGAALIYMRFGARTPRKKPLILAGLALMAAAALWLSRLPPAAGLGTLLPGLIGKGLFGVLVVIPIAGLTFRELRAEDFPHGYQSKNLLRQVAQSFASAFGAVMLENRQFVVHGALSDALGRHPAQAASWMDSVKGAFAASGLDPAQASQAASAQLAGLLDQQALLIASEDLYRLIAVLALLMGVALLVQRRLR